MTDFQNPAAIASRFINQTGCHIFLTGKAGTGKTTFLKKIVGYTHKKTVVAAPTGIAAINAGGVTLHSLFQLPFGAFVPSLKGITASSMSTPVTTPQSLVGKTQLNAAKRTMLRELELLIIDEVSMLRADLLDAIDTLLRHIRRKRNVPFGGLQILFIGDLWQLPPVVKQDEWTLLKHHYPSLFFFEAKALQENPPLYLELENIYRQTDLRFIHLLNNLRDNNLEPSDLALLNSHYQPGFDPTEQEGWVFLTTHNHKADHINRKALDRLPGQTHQFHARLDGDFSESQYPVEYTLELKEGAQVMFIKNDYAAERRYFNGKIGTVDEISEDGVLVRFSDGSAPAEVEPYTWENKKFSLNQDTNEIEEKVAGTFTHLPLKLAWAITVHKSQGLTFDKAVIDVAESFASGQTYVALSRLRSLDGLVLTTPFPARSPGADESLLHFVASKPGREVLAHRLRHETRLYLVREVEQAFDLSPLVWAAEDFLKGYNKDEKRSPRQAYQSFGAEILAEAKTLRDVAERFRQQMQRQGMLNHDSHLPLLQERIRAARAYFEPLLKDLSSRVFAHIKEVSGTSGLKKYIRELRDLEVVFFGRLQYIQKVEKLTGAILENAELNKQKLKNPDQLLERELLTAEAEKPKKGKGKKNRKAEPGPKEKKPDSKTVSFEMFRQGLSIDSIARARSLAESTIEVHLYHFLVKGEIEPRELVEPGKLEQIRAAARAVKSTRLNEVMAVLGSEFSYSDLRFALANVEIGSDQ